MTGHNMGEEISVSDPEIQHALSEAARPRHSDQTAGAWIKSNLFNNWYNGVITIVFGALGLGLGFLFLRFALFNARWEPVRDNLELFFVGRYPREERTRLVVQLLLMSGSVGLFIGWMRQRSQAAADLAGIERPSTSARDIGSSYWALVVFVVVALAIGVGVDSYHPWLLLLGCVVAAATSFGITMKPRRGSVGIGLAALPLVPLALAGGVLSTVPDLNNGGAYLIAVAATVLLAVVQHLHRPAFTLSAGALAGVVSFQVLSGSEQLSWVFLTAALIPAAFDVLSQRDDHDGHPLSGGVGSVVFAAGVVFYVVLAGLTPIRSIILVVGLGVALYALVSAATGEPGSGRRLGVLTVIGMAAWYIGRLIDLDGIDWTQWGGLHLNLVVAAASTTLAFPIGLLLALGRRSSLPVMRWLCTSYIELIRGVPLISLLLMAQLFVGFFLSSGNNNLSLTTKSLFVITMFSSAYIAEIVRGGLQAVPKGQTEAGQAMGLSPAKITRLLVLPQALRAVIPSMVGQFISLFKDTSLLTIIGVLEFLGVREIVHAQPDFRGFGLVETLVFVAFGFWAVSFTMSRESQRLERSLNVSN